MNKPTRDEAIKLMLRSAAELAADLAVDLDAACGEAQPDNMGAALARLAQLPEQLTLIGALIESVQQLNCAPVPPEPGA